MTLFLCRKYVMLEVVFTNVEVQTTVEGLLSTLPILNKGQFDVCLRFSWTLCNFITPAVDGSIMHMAYFTRTEGTKT
jgi:hypothetical protein